jgi:hypothetical protein
LIVDNITYLKSETENKDALPWWTFEALKLNSTFQFWH